ncbi:MAG: hypothetical protein HW406_1716 [Candidatus Brocadiaceae bacterium]|nr:hypothetical protein [Candidatus Brocadiaceae bacterium]
MGTATKVKSSYTRGDLMRRDKLIIEFLSLVKYVVGKIMVYLPPFVDKDDLIEYGILGLIEAAEKYDSKKETKFGTYAISRIRGAILDYLRSQDWLPRSVRDKATMVRDTYISLEQKLNRPPRSDEIAAVLKINPAEWDKLLAEISFSTFLSLEEYNQKSEDNSREDRNQQIKDTRFNDPLSSLETQEEKTLLANAISELPKRERLVITMYYYEDLMLKEISQLIGISESRVSQLHHRALFILRARMSRISVNA